ncbi:ATP-binding protein [Paenibacillus planticolens]|nr:HAMP domain-containing sensor histidine kinase [Paenibacillus planticolens]
MLIFSPLVIYPYLYKSQSHSTKFRLWLCLLFSAAIGFTMSIPVSFNGLVYDFRSIPLLVGSLYGGIYVAMFLYAALIVVRFFLGGPHYFIYIISFLPTILFVAILLRKYRDLNLAQKILAAVLGCIAIKLVTFLIYFSCLNNLELFATNLFATLKTYILQSIVIAVYIYLIEFLQTYIHMQEEAIQGEKIKIVSEMAASVAHEIRNPLTAVRGFIQLMAIPHLDQTKIQFYQQISLEELDRAQLIISDYLAIAKPEPEKDELINLKDEVQYVSQVLLTIANYHDVKMEVSLPDEQICIQGDRNKLRQSLINLGKNAIEAMPKNGGVLEIILTEQANKRIITMRDNGIGMTKEQISRLGTPYFSTKQKGTGLGTMVSFSLIRAMKGKIHITSEKGKGTEFEISFPAVRGDCYDSDVRNTTKSLL